MHACWVKYISFNKISPHTGIMHQDGLIRIDNSSTLRFLRLGVLHITLSGCYCSNVVIVFTESVRLCVFKLRLTDRGFREFARGFCL